MTHTSVFANSSFYLRTLLLLLFNMLVCFGYPLLNLCSQESSW